MQGGRPHRLVRFIWRGDRLRSLRKSRGLSLEDVAHFMRCSLPRKTSRATIQEWEEGQSEPRLTQVYILAKAFNRPMSYFVERGK